MNYYPATVIKPSKNDIYWISIIEATLAELEYERCDKRTFNYKKEDNVFVIYADPIFEIVQLDIWKCWGWNANKYHLYAGPKTQEDLKIALLLTSLGTYDYLAS